MARYIICPRCELNFIDADELEFCLVCQKEMSGESTFSDGFELEESLEETELCPICGENYMLIGEKMCDECKKKADYTEEEEDDEKEDASWRSYLDDEDETEDLGIPDFEFEDDEMEEEEEEEMEEEVDDFEYVSPNDYYDMDDDDEDDDDDFDLFDDDDAPTPKTGKKKKRHDDDDDF